MLAGPIERASRVQSTDRQNPSRESGLAWADASPNSGRSGAVSHASSS
jgi:hypothetical protein